MDKQTRRGRHRVDVENAIIRRREKQFNYEQMWNGASKYFDHWQKTNTRYESWTSPRYYEDNNKLVRETKNKRDREELLEKRRDKLKKLLEKDQQAYDVELLMVQTNKMTLDKPTTSKLDDIPIEVLKDVNMELKLKEEERRRHEAELKLYHQWRRNNPIVRQYESKYRSKDIKLCWLDQQIEKRMQKEKEDEENKRLLKIREEELQKQKEQEQNFKRYLEEKRQQLKRNLEQQMAELTKRQKENEELKKIEYEEMKKRSHLAEIEQQQALEKKRRVDREIALYNVQQHKLKLKQKAVHIQENLNQEKLFINKLKELQLEDMLTDEVKKQEIKNTLRSFLNVVKQQQELEKQRQKHLEFIFDSEAKSVYDKQCEMWKQEEIARQNLVKDVLATVQKQIEENLQKNKDKQTQLLLEREEMAKRIEQYDRELGKLNEEEEARKLENRKILDEEVKMKNAKKQLDENLKLKEINEELERIRKEEERLQQEIMRIQQRKPPPRSFRSSNLFF